MSDLKKFCEASLARDVPDELRVMANYLLDKHKGTVAILAYGSCIRGVAVSETLMDFYVLTENMGQVSSNAFSRIGCALVPPNVYYAEAGRGLRAKYAILPLSLFAAWMLRETRNPYFWARFSQPSALVYVRDEMAKGIIIEAVTQALRTSFANARALTPSTEALAIWTSGFSATYATEFRSEKTNRAAEIVETYANYYRQAAALLEADPPIHANQTMRRFAGKLWSAVRLIKAAFTFQGGADYIVWKIERHSGEKIVLTEWQRRHPVIAGFFLLGTLLRKGAVR
jgi:hypothetical protein